jgi:hypothetical protein
LLDRRQAQSQNARRKLASTSPATSPSRRVQSTMFLVGSSRAQKMPVNLQSSQPVALVRRPSGRKVYLFIAQLNCMEMGLRDAWNAADSRELHSDGPLQLVLGTTPQQVLD